MDAHSFVALLAACAPLVHPATASALVRVESGFNPLAIGVVGGRLERQPSSRVEALATARSLEARGIDFSLGLAQINVRNLPRLRLTLSDAFDPCRNLGAMESILCECFDRGRSDSAQVDLRLALSCYYSGNFVVGFRHGYVKRVVDAAVEGTPKARAPP